MARALPAGRGRFPILLASTRGTAPAIVISGKKLVLEGD